MNSISKLYVKYHEKTVGELTMTPNGKRCVFRYDKEWLAKGFIFREGRWLLAPAYDLTLVPEGYHGEHATSVNGNGKPTVEDMLSVGESIRIPKKHGLEIIDFVREHCKEILSKDYL